MKHLKSPRRNIHPSRIRQERNRRLLFPPLEVNEISRCENKAADLYAAGERDQGDDLLKQAIAVMQRHGPSAAIAQQYLDLCQSCMIKKDFRAMLEYSQEAEQQLRKAHVDMHDQLFGIAYNYQGWALLDTKDFAQAESNFHQALAIQLKGGEEKNDWVLSDLRGLATAAHAQKKYKEAIDANYQFIERAPPADKNIAFAHKHNGSYYIALRDFPAAEKELNIALLMFGKRKDRRECVITIGLLAQVKSGQSDFGRAIKLLHLQADMWQALHDGQSRDKALKQMQDVQRLSAGAKHI